MFFMCQMTKREPHRWIISEGHHCKLHAVLSKCSNVLYVSSDKTWSAPLDNKRRSPLLAWLLSTVLSPCTVCLKSRGHRYILAWAHICRVRYWRKAFAGLLFPIFSQSCSNSQTISIMWRNMALLQNCAATCADKCFSQNPKPVKTIENHRKTTKNHEKNHEKNHKKPWKNHEKNHDKPIFFT